MPGFLIGGEEELERELLEHPEFSGGDAGLDDEPEGRAELIGSVDASSKLHVFDLHCDTLDRLCLGQIAPKTLWSEQDSEIPLSRRSSLASNCCHIDLERTGQFAWCQCFAIFIPDEFRGDEAWKVFCHVRDFLVSEESEHASSLERVGRMQDAEEVFRLGKTASILTVEGAGFLEDSLDRIGQAADCGVKMMGIVWNGQNAVASGHDGDGGITAFGKEAIEEMERRRIVVDVSHLNDEGFKDVADLATRPFAASHSNLRSVCGHRRNLTEAQFRFMCESGCLVGLNYCRDFLSEWGKDPSRDEVLRMVDRMLELGGEKTLALGSDFDGCDVPSWLNGCQAVPELFSLLSSQFGHEVAERVFFRNAHEFFCRNES